MRERAKNQTSILEKYGFTEEMARKKCEEYGLLSPIYEFAPRGGCWFCPNARKSELSHLREYQRDLWNRLLELEEIPNLIAPIWNTLERKSIHMIDEQFKHKEEANGNREN